MPQQYRQGDVLITEIAESTWPNEAEPVPLDPVKGVVLAYGEATGHAHAIAPDEAMLYRSAPELVSVISQIAYLHVAGPDPTILRHDEHDAIQLPPGRYRVIRQREYAPGAVPKPVAD